MVAKDDAELLRELAGCAEMVGMLERWRGVARYRSRWWGGMH